ncbi:MAG TPA: 5'/3'-nucleotidase SurE, partial [Candidatus Acidoferrales bacterium]|nr:5'/3'-nucleotidase SurE [Candidatus Acidoferrales bacterium]
MRSTILAVVPLILLLSACGESSNASERLRVMVTNDDGFSAPGIAAMVDKLVSNASLDVKV